MQVRKKNDEKDERLLGLPVIKQNTNNIGDWKLGFVWSFKTKINKLTYSKIFEYWEEIGIVVNVKYSIQCPIDFETFAIMPRFDNNLACISSNSNYL